MADGRLRGGLATTGEAVLALALAVWLGGMIALGAFTAPLVFGADAGLPRPQAAALMTSIFRRFDGVVIVLAGITLLMSGLRAWDLGLRRLVSKLRLGVALILVAGGAVSALWVSPKIEAFLHAGVRRGVGPEGASLDRWHHLAEQLGKGEVALAALLLLLLVIDARARD